jgi:two-component system sensor histidine kinase ChiS
LGYFVLVVEDEPLHATLIMEMLEQAGINAVTCLRGREALSLAKATKPSLVIIDLLLPDLPGDYVIAKLRLIPGNAEVPIIAMTAYPDSTLEAVALNAGANLFLKKPIRVGRLQTEVALLMAQADERQQAHDPHTLYPDEDGPEFGP